MARLGIYLWGFFLYNEERIVRQTTCLPAKAGGSIYFKEGVV